MSSVRLVSSRFAARTCTVGHCSQSPILRSAQTWRNILPSQHVHLKRAFSLEEWYSVFLLCEILKRLRKLKESGFKTINLQPAHEAEIHALHWKQFLPWTWTTWFAALKTFSISPLVAKEFFMSVISCWFDMAKFRLWGMQWMFRDFLLIWASRQLKWPFAAAVPSELSLHLTSLQSVWELLYLPLPCHTNCKKDRQAMCRSQGMQWAKAGAVSSQSLYSYLGTQNNNSLCWSSSWKSR